MSKKSVKRWSASMPRAPARASRPWNQSTRESGTTMARWQKALLTAWCCGMAMEKWTPKIGQRDKCILGSSRQPSS